MLYTGLYDDQGEFKLSERIDITDTDDLPMNISSITIVENGCALIGGNDGVLSVGYYDDEGLVLGEQIDILDANERPVSISSISIAEDGHVLIGGENGVLYTGFCGINLEMLKQHLPEIIEKGRA